MNQRSDHRPSREELSFFGKIGAGVSHDIRNVLSIVNENTGLLEDQLELAERGRPLDREKLKEICARITRQVKRGTRTMQRFSRFAHAADEQPASSDLTAIAETVAALAERHVALAGCRLQTDLPDESIHVNANPFSLQHALFSAIELILESVDDGRAVTIKLASRGTAAMMSVSGDAASAGELSGRLSRLSAATSQMAGSVETAWDDGVLSVILTFPAN
jgi:nitrogen fixation/metabolism regulation signal transduction histidine kinase